MGIDGEFYYIRSDGVAYPVGGEKIAPFVVVTFFESDSKIQVENPIDCKELQNHLDELLPTKNTPYAIKIEGKYDYLKTRSVPNQNEPYPPLADVLKTQPTFEFNNIRGVMVGFRLPDYIGEFNAPGYHFHFITEDKCAGGHVLECNLQSGSIEIDYTDRWNIKFPESGSFYKVNLPGK